MTLDWNDFLTIDAKNNADATAEHAQASNGNIQCHLSQYGLIVVAGPDAANFMQGQFTNDVTKVDNEHAQLNAFCNNKGRMISNFTLFQYQQNYFINIHKSLIDTTIEHLQRYILRAQVAVQDVSEQLVSIGISGETATKKLAEIMQASSGTSLTNGLTNEQLNVSANNDYIAIKTADEMPRYFVFAEMEKAQTLWSRLNNDVTTVHNSAWEYLNIQAGLPVISKNTQEEFVPQMTNMELLNAVNFKKGCYTGQEIIARMHYLGKLKKRMYKVHIATNDSAQTPQAGDKVFAENARAGQNTGMLISAEANPDGGYDALSVLQIADAQSTLTLLDENGPVITVKTLPYSFEKTNN